MTTTQANEQSLTTQNLTQNINQKQHELEYLEDIKLHLNEEFLHLKTLQISGLGGDSGTPFHVLWRPVDEEELEVAAAARHGGSKGGTPSNEMLEQRHRHSCLFVARELWKTLLCDMSENQFKKIVNSKSGRDKGVAQHKIMACKKAHPNIMGMLLDITFDTRRRGFSARQRV